MLFVGFSLDGEVGLFDATFKGIFVSCCRVLRGSRGQSW